MTTEVTVFSHKEFGDVRTVTIDGVIYFVGKDVAMALGYSNTKDALAKHVDDEDKRGSQIATSGQRREMTVINESGLYSLIFASKLPAAKKFKHWVTAEVLPSIRKTGYYISPRVDRLAIAKENAKMLRFAVSEVGKVQESLKEKGVPKFTALAMAVESVEKSLNYDLSPISRLIPRDNQASKANVPKGRRFTEENGRDFETTKEVCDWLGLDIDKINQKLVEWGLQTFDGEKYWLTDEGWDYGAMHPVYKNGRKEYEVRWSGWIWSRLFKEKGECSKDSSKIVRLKQND